MTNQYPNNSTLLVSNQWLKPYYFSRAAFSISWVVAAVIISKNLPTGSAALFLAYPAWDAAANLADAIRNGGLKKNLSQTLNALVSAITTIAVGIALGISINAVIIVFGVWAALAGLFQLVTGVRRWRTYGAQLAMVLSGAQSVLAGVHFIHKGTISNALSIVDIAPYAGFGAFYFLTSAILLTMSDAKRRKAESVKTGSDFTLTRQ